MKGRYDAAPYPVCEGRIDHDTSGDTKNKLDKSIKLVRDFPIPGWNILPETAHLYKKDVFMRHERCIFAPKNLVETCNATITNRLQYEQ